MTTDAILILKICELFRIKRSTQTVADALGISEPVVARVIADWFE